MRFLELPAELRNHIYDLVLRETGVLEIRHRHVFEIDYASTRALSQVSKQLRVECLPIYYSSNKFLLLSMDNCVAWLTVIGHDCRHLRQLLLGDGVLDGMSWTGKKNDPHHRVNVSYRLLITDDLTLDESELISEDVVEDEMKVWAKARLKAIGDATKDFGPLDLVISTTVYHCKHCAHGSCFWCRYSQCCMKG